MQRPLIALALLLLLPACGQKGNLYLPEDREPVPASTGPAADAAASPDASQDPETEARRRARSTTGN